MEDRYYFLGFSVFSGIGPKRFHDVYAAFGSAKNAWEADDTNITEVLGKGIGSTFLQFRKTFSIEAYAEKLEQSGAWFLTLPEAEYPTLLSEIRNPPFVLYGKGDKEILCHPGRSFATDRISTDEKNSIASLRNDIFIGVVGTRRISSYGKQVTEMVTRELVLAGCVIVSGLAMGVDAVSHQTTVRNGGKTIAVLGSGVDVCHPAINLPIYNSIIAGHGAVVSEYPLGEPPSKGSFPSRNRIIAGLSHGIVVTEGAADSGALYTATDAFENGRPVFAVPGPITSSLSKAPNSLLTKGAKLVTSGKDILDDLGISIGQRAESKGKMKGETEEEQRIIDLLENEALLFDEIVRETQYGSEKTGILLTLMEMKGVISNNGGQYSLNA